MPAVNGRIVHSPTVSPNPGPGLSPAFHKANEATENVWLAIGKASETLGDMERALNAYERVLRTNPKALRALTQAAQICRHKEAYQRAIDYFNRAIALNNRDGEVWGSLGHCFLMQDDLGSAYTAYQQALFHLPHPKDDPKLWYGIGILYDRYGSLDHAEEAFQSVLRMDPNFEKADEIHFRLGIIYKQLQRYTDSLKCFNMILHHPPNPLTQMDIWFQIGHVHDQQKDYLRAKEAWERVLADSPDHAKVLQQLGWLFHQPSAPFCNQELAVQYLTKSIESDASDAQSWYLLGRAYMTSEKYNKAYEAYQQAVYRDGRNPTFWISIGVLYFQINQYKDALDAYTRAIRLNPYISEVWFDLGSLYESCNRQLQDAIDAYLRAKELDPNNQVVVERLDILRRYEKDPSINIPSPPLPRDVHPTAYASNQRGQEKKSIKRLAMPDGVNGGSAPPPPPPPQSYGIEGRPGSRPASSSGRYRNSSMGPSRDEPRYGQGDIIMAEAQRERDRERERAYSNSSTVRPDSAPSHSHHPHGGQVLAPVINHPQQMPPPQTGGYRRSGNGRGGSRPRSMSPANYRPQNGSPLASVHSVAYGQHSSAAGGQYNSYAPTPTQGRYDRPRSPPGGSSARGGAYNLPPPSTVQRTPGSESNDMVWERDPRAYPQPPPLDTREFVDRPDRSVRVKEEPRERSVRPGPGGPSVNGGPPSRSYTHERHPSDGYEPRNGGRPQPSPHGSYQYPGPYEWRGRGSPPPGQGPPPPPPSQPQRRYDPLQEDRAPPASQYPPYPPQGPPGPPRHQGSHSPVAQSYDDRRIPPMSQGPPESLPERGRRGRRSEKYEQPPPPPPPPQKEGTPGARRRNLPRKKDGRDSMVATPAPGQGPEENGNGSPSWRSNGPHDDYPRPGPPPTSRHQSDYNEAQRQGPPQPQHRPDQMSPPPSSAATARIVDDDYDEPGAADALMGLSKSRGSGGHPPFSSNGPRRSSPTPSQTNSNRKRRRSGSSLSTYEESRRGSGDPNVPEPERKKQRLDEEQQQQAQSRPQAPPASRQNTFPSIRTIDDLTNPSDAGKRQSPTSKSSKPNSHAESMKSPPVLPPMQQSPPRAGEPADVEMEGVESPTRLRASKTKSPLSPTSPARVNGNSNGKTAPPLVSHSPSPSHSGSRAASVSGPA